jgi:hypothetical protein
MTKKIEKTESEIGIETTAAIDTGQPNPADHPHWGEREAAQHDHYERRPGRKEHLEKIANAVSVKEVPASEPIQRKVDHHGHAVHVHSEVGAGR